MVLRRDESMTSHGLQLVIDSGAIPSPTVPEAPCSRHLVRDWWERTATLAKLPTGQRLGWRSLRQDGPSPCATRVRKT
jgi:hypothetical protein